MATFLWNTQFTDRVRPFDATGFLRAIEEENEDSAVSMARGGMRDGMKFDDFEPRLLSLVREIVYATREEKIPGFRGVPPRAGPMGNSLPPGPARAWGRYPSLCAAGNVVAHCRRFAAVFNFRAVHSALP